MCQSLRMGLAVVWVGLFALTLPAAEKGVGLTVAEQANIEAAINRLKQDLLAECLLTPEELKRFAKVPAATDLRRFGPKPVGKQADAKDEAEKDAKLRAALAEAEKNGRVSGSLAQKFMFGLGEESLVGWRW